MGKKIEAEKIEIEKPVKRKGNSLLVIILILIVLIMGAYILNEKGILPLDLTTNNQKEEKQEPANSIVVEEKESTTEEVQPEETKPVEVPKEEPKSVNKILNTSGIEYKNLTTDQGNYGLSMKINNELNNIILTIEWDKFGPIASPIVGGFTWATGAKEDLLINGFSSKIKDVFIGDIGQDACGLTLFYLMENGTIEYTPLFIQRYDGKGNLYYQINYHYNYSSDGKIVAIDFTSSGQLKGVNEIVKLYNSDASGSMSSWKTVIASKQDGSAYDLGNIINN